MSAPKDEVNELRTASIGGLWLITETTIPWPAMRSTTVKFVGFVN